MPVMQSAPGPETIIDGRRVLYFAGCGYLGLQGDPRVIEAACEATRKFGIHTATSRGGFGDSPPVLAVEKRAAEFFGAEDAFYFPTGYAGNSILVDTTTTYDLIAVDSDAHYAARQAAKIAIAHSGGKFIVFNHGDADHLREVLDANKVGDPRILVMCDGVSPVLGDIAPVWDYIDVLTDFDWPCNLQVDDAHGVGVLGSGGRGVLQWRSEQRGRPLAMNGSGAPGHVGDQVAMCATLSKAIGGYGGIIPGSRERLTTLRSEWYRGASALPAGVAAATAKALEIVMAEPQLRASLHANVKRTKDGLRSLGLNVNDTPVPIICLQLGDAANMQRIQQSLMQRDIAIAYIKSYSGVGPQGALRIAVFANHTTAMIDRLIEELRRLL